MFTTQGLSPKLIPSFVGVVVGLVVIFAVDKGTGLAILTTALASLGLGAAAGPGNVQERQIGPGNDALLGDKLPLAENGAPPPTTSW